MIDPLTTLGSLAATGKGARAVLLRHQLDFCCRGGQLFADACAAAGLDVSAVAEEIAAASQQRSDDDAVDWSQQPLEDVVAYILEHFHAPLPQQLDAVIAAAEKVERVHAAKPTCPKGLAAHLRRVRDDLASHMAKEEQVLFPAIVAGRRGRMLGGPVTVMLREHEDHGEGLSRTRELATDFQPPAEACATWRTLYDELAQLEADLMEHIHLENHVLFPGALARQRASHAPA